MRLVLDRWKAGWGGSHLLLLALLLLPPLRRSHDLGGTVLVGRVVEQSTDVMNEKRIQQLGDFLLIGKVQCTLIRNPGLSQQTALYVSNTAKVGRGNIPDTLQVHGTNLDNMANLFTLQNSVSSSSRHAGHVQKLGAIDHVVIYEIG